MPITHDATYIRITGDNTGDELRRYISDNSLTDPVVNDRNITFTARHLWFIPETINGVAVPAVLTDSNALYHFTGGARNYISGTSEMNLTNVMYVIGGGARGYYGNCPGGVLNWTNCRYQILTSGGRTDFFNASARPNLTGAFSNVQFIADGLSYMHLFGSAAQPSDYSELTLDIDGGCVFEYCSMSDSIFTPNFTKLYNDRGTCTFTRHTWLNPNWWLAGGGARATGVTKFIDPTKPSGWTGYTGAVAKVTEYFTHNLTARDLAGQPIENLNVRLINNTLTANVYDTTTDPAGEIAEQEILTYKGATPAAYYADFTLKCWGYRYTFKSESRPFATTGQPISETVTMLTDMTVAEADSSIVAAYPFTVTLPGGSLKITGNNSTLQTVTAAQLYDAVKLFSADNPAYVTRLETDIDAGAFDVDLDYVTYTGSIRTTGTVTLSNGSTVSGGIIDSTGDSFLSFKDIESWKIYATQSNANKDKSALANGSGIFRFNYVAGTTYYLRLVASGEQILKTITPVEAGETLVSLSSVALLGGIANAVSDVSKEVGETKVQASIAAQNTQT